MGKGPLAELTPRFAEGLRMTKKDVMQSPATAGRSIFSAPFGALDLKFILR
jgi:hypothetical protein